MEGFEPVLKLSPSSPVFSLERRQDLTTIAIRSTANTRGLGGLPIVDTNVLLNSDELTNLRALIIYRVPALPYHLEDANCTIKYYSKIPKRVHNLEYIELHPELKDLDG